ncbi:MAG: hypothetical protein ACYCYO_04805 [Bacilli bacterium]
MVSTTVMPSSSAFAATAPAVSDSWYINSSQNPTSMGKNQAYGSGIVILDFGQLTINSSDQYGMDNFSGVFWTNSQIQQWVQHFINGWNSDHTSSINVVVGASNYNMNN